MDSTITGGPVSVYCDGVGYHVLCLWHGIPVSMAAHWSKHHCFKQAPSRFHLRCLKAMFNPNKQIIKHRFCVQWCVGALRVSPLMRRQCERGNRPNGCAMIISRATRVEKTTQRGRVARHSVRCMEGWCWYDYINIHTANGIMPRTSYPRFCTVVRYRCNFGNCQFENKMVQWQSHICAWVYLQ